MSFFNIFGKSRRREAEDQARVVQFTIGMLMDDLRMHAIAREAEGSDETLFRGLQTPLLLVCDMFREDNYTQQLQDLTSLVYDSLEVLDIPMPKSEELRDKDWLIFRLSELVELAVLADLEFARRTFEERFCALFPVLKQAVSMIDTARASESREIMLADPDRFLELTGIIIPELQRIGVQPPRIPESRYAEDFNNRLRVLRDFAAIGALEEAREL